MQSISMGLFFLKDCFELKKQRVRWKERPQRGHSSPLNNDKGLDWIVDLE